MPQNSKIDDGMNFQLIWPSSWPGKWNLGKVFGWVCQDLPIKANDYMLYLKKNVKVAKTVFIRPNDPEYTVDVLAKSFCWPLFNQKPLYHRKWTQNQMWDCIKTSKLVLIQWLILIVHFYWDKIISSS